MLVGRVYVSVHIGLDAYYAAGPRVGARLAAIPHPFGALYDYTQWHRRWRGPTEATRGR